MYSKKTETHVFHVLYICPVRTGTYIPQCEKRMGWNVFTFLLLERHGIGAMLNWDMQSVETWLLTLITKLHTIAFDIVSWIMSSLSMCLRIILLGYEPFSHILCSMYQAYILLQPSSHRTMDKTVIECLNTTPSHQSFVQHCAQTPGHLLKVVFSRIWCMA